MSECVPVHNVGIADNNFSQFKVYPNPTTEKVEIEFSENPLNANIEVHSMDGKLVDQFINVNAKQVLIDLSENPNGIYFLRIQNSNFTKVVKLIKY